MDKIISKLPIFNFAFGFITLIGGVIGYMTAQSIPSLGSAFFFGNLLMLSIWGCGQGKKDIKPKYWGFYLASIVSAFLLGFFVWRLMHGAKAMPAAIIIPLAIVGILANVYVLHKASLNEPLKQES